jgi:hypothetical protein
VIKAILFFFFCLFFLSYRMFKSYRTPYTFLFKKVRSLRWHRNNPAQYIMQKRKIANLKKRKLQLRSKNMLFWTLKHIDSIQPVKILNKRSRVFRTCDVRSRDVRTHTLYNITPQCKAYSYSNRSPLDMSCCSFSPVEGDGRESYFNWWIEFISFVFDGILILY